VVCSFHNFEFARVKNFVEKKSHRLLLRPGRSAPVPGRSNVAERDGSRVGGTRMAVWTLLWPGTATLRQPASPVRGEIAVETHPKTSSSSVRSGIFHPSPADVAPDGAYDFHGTPNYKYAAPTALGNFSLAEAADNSPQF
jgi:hypothetical protein